MNSHNNHHVYLVFGGVCGNWQAYTALLSLAKQQGIPKQNIIITGDLIAYYADGAKVAEHCRTQLSQAIIVRGNCERTVASDADDCGCGFNDNSLCSLLSDQWFQWAKKTVSATTKKWMHSLPIIKKINIGNKKIAVLHATPTSDNTFIFASTDDGQKQAFLEELNCDGVIAGHSGLPFTSKLSGNQIWHNSGALGMPANDGTPRTWYALWHLEQDRETITIQHKALEYDFTNTIKSARDAKLSPEYQNTLQTGIWPDNSILPPKEQTQEGTAITPTTILWGSS